MAAKTVLNYLPRESVIHKLTGTTKLAFFLLFRDFRQVHLTYRFPIIYRVSDKFSCFLLLQV